MTRERVALQPSGASARERSRIADYALRRGFSMLVLAPQDRRPPRDGVQLFDRTEGQLRPRPAGRPIRIVPVDSPSDLARAREIGLRDGAVAVSWVRDRVIPLENLRADAGSSFRVWTLIERPSELPAALGALEHGAHGVVVPADSLEAVDAIEAALEHRPPPLTGWKLVQLRNVRSAGMGDRVLVDTTSILRPTEGLLVGSAAAFLFHVASEAEGSAYTRPRSFRVNAGAAHSYVLLADGTTRYLSELAPGDAVFVSEPRAAGRSVRVGRVKIERRPLTLLEARVEGQHRTLFVQEAETVRLSGAQGRRAVTRLGPGDRVIGCGFPPGRHMGQAIEEAIEER
ncbi:MAG: 3-dehydroquinate synthase II [Thermoplasmata archaeon]